MGGGSFFSPAPIYGMTCTKGEKKVEMGEESSLVPHSAVRPGGRMVVVVVAALLLYVQYCGTSFLPSLLRLSVSLSSPPPSFPTSSSPLRPKRS